MRPRARRRAAAAAFAVAVAAGAPHGRAADADGPLCEQLAELAHVKAAVQATLVQSKAAEETIVALAERMADELKDCARTPDGGSCQPGLRSQVTASIQKLTAQIEELQTARQAIEQRLQEVDARRRAFLEKLQDKDGCPHARW